MYKSNSEIYVRRADKCAYLSCNNGRHTGHHLYRFPKDKALQNKWISVIGNRILHCYSTSTLERMGVCPDHFSAEMFKLNPYFNRGRKRMLKSDAIPNPPEILEEIDELPKWYYYKTLRKEVDKDREEERKQMQIYDFLLKEEAQDVLEELIVEEEESERPVNQEEFKEVIEEAINKEKEMDQCAQEEQEEEVIVETIAVVEDTIAEEEDTIMEEEETIMEEEETIMEEEETIMEEEETVMEEEEDTIPNGEEEIELHMQKPAVDYTRPPLTFNDSEDDIIEWIEIEPQTEYEADIETLPSKTLRDLQLGNCFIVEEASEDDEEVIKIQEEDRLQFHNYCKQQDEIVIERIEEKEMEQLVQIVKPRLDYEGISSSRIADDSIRLVAIEPETNCKTQTKPQTIYRIQTEEEASCSTPANDEGQIMLQKPCRTYSGPRKAGTKRPGPQSCKSQTTYSIQIESPTSSNTSQINYVRKIEPQTNYKTQTQPKTNYKMQTETPSSKTQTKQQTNYKMQTETPTSSKTQTKQQTNYKLQSETPTSSKTQIKQQTNYKMQSETPTSSKTQPNHNIQTEPTTSSKTQAKQQTNSNLQTDPATSAKPQAKTFNKHNHHRSLTILPHKSQYELYMEDKNSKLAKENKGLREQLRTFKRKFKRLKKSRDIFYDKSRKKETVDEFLDRYDCTSDAARTLVKLQLKSDKTVHTAEERDLAKMLFCSSSSVYQNLRRSGCHLPGESTVRKWLATESNSEIASTPDEFSEANHQLELEMR